MVNLKARLLRGSTPSCDAESTGRQNNTATERVKKKKGERRSSPPRYRHILCLYQRGAATDTAQNLRVMVEDRNHHVIRKEPQKPFRVERMSEDGKYARRRSCRPSKL